MSSWEWALIILLIIADCGTTYYAMERGYDEVNPLMNKLMELVGVPIALMFSFGVRMLAVGVSMMIEDKLHTNHRLLFVGFILLFHIMVVSNKLVILAT